MMNKSWGLLSSFARPPLAGNSTQFTASTIAFSETACKYVQCRHQSYLATVRRQKIRQQWASKNAYNERPDANIFDYPRERLGRHYDLNWALHKYKVAPMNEAFRNLHLGGLMMYAQGTTDKNKALHTTVNETQENFAVYYGEKVPSYSKGSTSISIDNYKQIVKQIKDHLCNVEALFVHDGAVGSHGNCEVRVRAITDDGTSALYLHHLLPKVSLGKPADFQNALTVYIAPSLRIPNAEALGLKSSSFVILDVARGIAFIVGTHSTKAIRSALVSLASPRLQVDGEFVPLQADLVEIPKQGRPLLVVSPDGALQKKGINFNVVGGSNVAWGSSGIYRLFDAVTSPVAKGSELSRGDLVENVTTKSGQVSRATVRRAYNFNSHPHPSAIVVAVADASGVLPAVSKVSPAGLKSFFLAGPTGSKDAPFKSLISDVDAKVVSEKLAGLAEGQNVGVFVVNLTPKNGELSNDDVKEILTTIGEGGANSANGLSNVFSNLTPITSLKGVNASLDPTKGTTVDAYKQQAAKYDSAQSSFIATNYPAQQ